MSDGELLLKAIREHSAQDMPRLMYADWLEENGGQAGELRARFIRDQVWLAANPSCGSCTGPEWAAGKPCPECREREERRGRTAVEMFGRERWLEWAHPAHRCVPAGALWDDHIHFSRGFVSDVICTLAAFMEHAAALFRAHPIERVTLTDRRPFDLPIGFAWVPDATGLKLRHELPRELATERKGEWFDAEEAAREWLSARCVAYGRSLAGLSAARAGEIPPNS